MLNFSDNGFGKITIGINPTFSFMLSPIFLADFHLKYPNVQVRLVEETSIKLEEMLYNQQIDVYIGTTPMLTDRLTIKKLFKETSTLILPKRLVQNNVKVPKISQNIRPLINGKDFIESSINSGIQRINDAYFAKFNIHPNSIIQNVKLSTAFFLATHGVGATLMPRHAINLFSPANKIYMVDLSPESLSYDVSIMYNKDSSVTEEMRLFTEIAVKKCKLNIIQ